MTDLAPGTQDRRTTQLGWAMVLIFGALFWNIIQMPRTALDQRDFLHALHYTLGFAVLVMALLRLAWWRRAPSPKPPPGLPEASFAFNRAILLALVLTFGVTGLMGFLYAWGDGHQVSLFGVDLPQILSRSEPLRMSMGYMHSALSFYYLMLFTVWIAFGVYQHLRYRVGLLRLLPGSRV